MTMLRMHKIYRSVYLLGFVTLFVIRCSTETPAEQRGSKTAPSADKTATSATKQKPSTKGTEVATSPSGGQGTQDPGPEEEKEPPPSGSTGTETSKTPSEDPVLALHQPMPTTCASCHESKRLTPDHYKGQDCAMCHKYPSFKGGAFAHDPKPATCEGCHARPTTVGLRAYPNQGPPANFDPNDPMAPGSGHYRGKDCSSCHQTPREGATAFVYNHTTPNPGACLPCHFNQGQRRHRNNNNVMLTGFGNCQTCHNNFARPNRNFDPN